MIRIKKVVWLRCFPVERRLKFDNEQAFSDRMIGQNNGESSGENGVISIVDSMRAFS